MKKWKHSVLYLSMALMILLAACSGNTSTPGGKEDEPEEVAVGSTKSISIGLTNAPLMFNPIDQTDNTSIQITSILFPPLMELDEYLNFVPMLADQINTSDNQLFVVELNPGAVWTDGEPVTADDVLFTIGLIGHPKFNTALSTRYAILEGFDELGKLPEGTTDIAGVKKVDDHTIEFRTKNPVDPSLFFENFGKNLKILPEHVLQDADPENLPQHPFFQNPDVVYGAFKFVNYAKDQYVELEANPDYFKGAPKLDKLFFKIMPAANIVAQLQSGEIDMNFPGIGTISVQDFEKVKNMSNVETISGKPFNYQNMYFNVEKIPDAKVRQAIAYAMNREMMVNNLLKGEGEIMDVQYTPIHPYYDHSLTPYPYDPEKAKQLLEEAGWDSSTTLEFAVPTGNKTREQTADIIVENLKDVGINVQVQKFDVATIVQKLRAKDYDLALLGLLFILDPDLSGSLSTNGGANFSGYSNEEMDELLEQGKIETNPELRRQVYTKVQELIVRDLPQISLYADYRLKAISKRVIVGEPKELGAFINVHQWDVEE